VSPEQYVANALMKVWFKKRYNDKDWLESEDGKNWTEIALLDATVAVDAYKEWHRST
jgi:hypothetical protein